MNILTVENIAKTYYYIALFSTITYIIKMFLFSHLDMDSEVVSDFDSIEDIDASFDFLSIQSVLAFLMGFGWIGLAALTQWHIGIKISILCALAVGVLFMFLSAYLMYAIKKLNQFNDFDINKCIGTTGKAYTNINSNSEGQIQIEINKKLVIKSAINAADVEIKAFEPIKVVKVEDKNLYIEKI